jgi:hypothetical protein
MNKTTTSSGSAKTRRRQDRSTSDQPKAPRPAVDNPRATQDENTNRRMSWRRLRTTEDANATPRPSSVAEGSETIRPTTPRPAPSRQRETKASMDTIMLAPPADLITPTCLRLAELQRVRLFCIVSQSRCDRSMESALARCLGFDPNATEAERKAVFARAKAIRVAVENENEFDPLPPGDQRAESLAAFLPLVPISAQARSTWDVHREGAEAEMRRLVITLPVYAWAKEHARGVGEIGLARIVGSAPLIGVYVTPQKLWKRMGVAVIDGERQQKKSDADEALIHGYAPTRRAELWSVCSDTMFRHQWRKNESVDEEADAPGRPIGAYGFVYQQRKLHTLSRIAETDALSFKDKAKWTRSRCDKDARRVMSKEFLRDLWSVWRGLDARWPARWSAAQEAAEAA